MKLIQTCGGILVVGLGMAGATPFVNSKNAAPSVPSSNQVDPASSTPSSQTSQDSLPKDQSKKTEPTPSAPPPVTPSELAPSSTTSVTPSTQETSPPKKKKKKKKKVAISSPTSPDGTAPTPPHASPPTTPNEIKPPILSLDLEEGNTGFNEVTFVDKILEKKLKVQRVNSDRSTYNLLDVYVGLKNLGGRTLKLEIQTVYKDNLGVPMHADSASWLPFELKPHEARDYRSSSFSTDARDYRVKIRLEPQITDEANGPGSLKPVNNP